MEQDSNGGRVAKRERVRLNKTSRERDTQTDHQRKIGTRYEKGINEEREVSKDVKEGEIAICDEVGVFKRELGITLKIYEAL